MKLTNEARCMHCGCLIGTIAECAYFKKGLLSEYCQECLDKVEDWADPDEVERYYETNGESAR